MSSAASFPFGEAAEPRPARRPGGPGSARCFVLGVYPSALHVQWRLPAWAHEKAGKSVIGSLAISDEPEVFWDGAGAERLVAEWKARVGFRDGDGPSQWGQVFAAGNGTSGRPVRDHVLVPLGLDPVDVWFTDVVNTYFVKTGKGQQGAAVGLFNTVAPHMDLAEARLPARPTPAELIKLAVQHHRERLRAELVEASAPIVVTLGEEARSVLDCIADASDGEPSRPLTGATASADSYGGPGTVTIGGWTGRWFALVHPGNRAKQWRKLHADWVELTKKARARADAGSAESRD